MSTLLHWMSIFPVSDRPLLETRVPAKPFAATKAGGIAGSLGSPVKVSFVWLYKHETEVALDALSSLRRLSRNSFRLNPRQMETVLPTPI